MNLNIMAAAISGGFTIVMSIIVAIA